MDGSPDEQCGYPRGFADFANRARSEGRKIGNIGKFAARFRHARKLRRIIFDDMSDLNCDIYTELFRISLLHSAAEQLLGKNGVRNFVVKDLELANSIRANWGDLGTFLSHRTGSAVGIGKFLASKHDANIFPFVIAIRHLTFHGVLTPTAAKLSSESAFQLLNEVSTATLSALEKSFADSYGHSH